MQFISSAAFPRHDVADFARARQWLQEADSLILTAGAGMAADAGLPAWCGGEEDQKTFRWPTREGVPFAEIVNGETFADDPTLSWGGYGHWLARSRDAVPHAGLALLNALAAAKSQGMFVFTSNVDGQFQRAGVAEERIVECYGSLHHLQCSADCAGMIWPADEVTPQVDMVHGRLSSSLPRCPACGAVARPNILMSSDHRWNEQRTDVQYGHMRAWLDQVKHPVVIELGAGVAELSVRRMGERLGVPLLRVNPSAWAVSGADQIGLPCGSLEGLQLLLT